MKGCMQLVLGAFLGIAGGLLLGLAIMATFLGR
jgi:hypothetical protein